MTRRWPLRRISAEPRRPNRSHVHSQAQWTNSGRPASQTAPRQPACRPASILPLHRRDQTRWRRPCPGRRRPQSPESLRLCRGVRRGHGRPVGPGRCSRRHGYGFAVRKRANKAHKRAYLRRRQQFRQGNAVESLPTRRPGSPPAVQPITSGNTPRYATRARSARASHRR